MSKLDWQALSAGHDADPAEDSAEWLAALDAFDSDPRERQRALDADPLMMFRKLPSPPALSVDVEAMKRDVAHLRRTEAVVRPHSPSARRRAPMRKLQRWLPLAAAFTLATGAAGYVLLPEPTVLLPESTVLLPESAVLLPESVVLPESTGSLPAPTESPGTMALAASAPLPNIRAADAPTTFTDSASSANAFDDAASAAALAGMPLVESLDPDAGSLVQIENAALSLVLVLPTHQDV